MLLVYTAVYVLQKDFSKNEELLYNTSFIIKIMEIF